MRPFLRGWTGKARSTYWKKNLLDYEDFVLPALEVELFVTAETRWGWWQRSLAFLFPYKPRFPAGATAQLKAAKRVACRS